MFVHYMKKEGFYYNIKARIYYIIIKFIGLSGIPAPTITNKKEIKGL
jgi:hypothetical protein